MKNDKKFTALKAAVKTKFKISNTSSTTTHFWQNHDLNGKNHTKMDASMLRLVQGKYTKRTNCKSKSVLNEISARKQRPKRVSRKGITVKENKTKADKIETKGNMEQNHNVLNYCDKNLHFEGVMRRCKIRILTANREKSKNLTKCNVRKRSQSEKSLSKKSFTSSKRSKSEESSRSCKTHAEQQSQLAVLEKFIEPTERVAISNLPQFDECQEKSIKYHKDNETENSIVSTNSTSCQMATKLDRKQHFFFLKKILNKWLETNPINSPPKATKLNATNSPQLNKSTITTRRLANATKHAKDMDTEMKSFGKGATLSNFSKEKPTKIKRCCIKLRRYKPSCVKNSTQVENLNPPINTTKCEKDLKTVERDYWQIDETIVTDLNCETKLQNSSPISNESNIDISKGSFNSLEQHNTNVAKQTHHYGDDIIDLEDETHAINIPSNNATLKNLKPPADHGIQRRDLSPFWRSSSKEALKIPRNSPETLAFTNLSQKSFTTDSDCIIISNDVPIPLASDGCDDNLISFHRNSTLVQEFQNIVRDAMSHLYTSSQDLQIDADLVNIKNSVDEFSKYLRTTFQNIEGMEKQIKQDIIHINSGEFRKLTANAKR